MMDSCLIWNARGIGNNESLVMLKSLIRNHKPSLVVILEPKLSGDRIQHIARKIPFPNFLHFILTFGFFGTILLRFPSLILLLSLYLSLLPLKPQIPPVSVLLYMPNAPK